MEDSRETEAAVNGESNDVEPETHHVEDDKPQQQQPHTGDGASPGKIFIGGLARVTSSAQFVKHFGNYGEIIDSVIMKDRNTGQPRGFGFVTYADPSVVDKVIEDTHIINGKQVEIKRTTPRGAGRSKDFRTKKIFVGGIPTTVTEDEFKDFFSKYGEISDHQLMRDHSSRRSRGFGFLTFDMEQSVDNILANGNRIEFAGAQVEIKKAEPKKPDLPPPPYKRPSNSRAAFGSGYGGGSDSGDFGSGSYRSSESHGGRASTTAYGGYGWYGGGHVSSSFGGFRGESSFGYSSRYGGGFGRGYDVSGGFGRGYDVGNGFGLPGEGYGSDGGSYGGSYDAGPGGGIGGPFHGSRGGYGGAGGSGRYHPYGR